MPYTKAHWYMLALLPITVWAFWPSYFGTLAEAPVEHHLHGITGTLWILLLAAQSYSIHSRRRALHRTMGKAVFVLGPLMIGAFSMVSWAGARKAAVQHPFYENFGRALLTADVLLTFATALILYLALRYRRHVHLHSALMISTVIGLLPPIFARLFASHLPGMIIEGPDTLYRFGYALFASFIVGAGLAVVLALRYRPHSWPWWLAAGIAALSYLLYQTLGQTELWTGWMLGLAGWSALAAYGFGVVLGLLACVLGWRRTA